MQNNSFTLNLPKLGFLAGTVTVTGGVPALGSLSSGPSSAVATSLITIADNGTGDFTISVRNFKGPQGIVLGFGSGKTLGTIVNAQTGSYSGDTASMQFLVSDAAGVAADGTFNFTLWAF